MSAVPPPLDWITFIFKKKPGLRSSAGVSAKNVLSAGGQTSIATLYLCLEDAKVMFFLSRLLFFSSPRFSGVSDPFTQSSMKTVTKYIQKLRATSHLPTPPPTLTVIKRTMMTFIFHLTNSRYCPQRSHVFSLVLVAMP